MNWVSVFDHFVRSGCERLMWRRGVVVITTAQLHSTRPELGFCDGEISDNGPGW